MFDVFCVKISLVWVIYFIHNINLKKNKHFLMKLNLAIIHQNCLSLIWEYFSPDWATNARLVSVEDVFLQFEKTSLNCDYFGICSSNWSKIKKIWGKEFRWKSDKLSVIHEILVLLQIDVVDKVFDTDHWNFDTKNVKHSTLKEN